MHNWLIVYNWLVLVFAAVGWCEVIWAGRVITFSPLRCESGEPRTAGATAGLFSYLASQTEHVYSFFSTLNRIGIYCWQIIPAAVSSEYGAARRTGLLGGGREAALHRPGAATHQSSYADIPRNVDEIGTSQYS